MLELVEATGVPGDFEGIVTFKKKHRITHIIPIISRHHSMCMHISQQNNDVIDSGKK